MTDRPNVKLVAFVGLPGAGKSSAVEYLTEKGHPKVYFGGIIYRAMTEAGIDITWDSQQTFREEIRQKEGNDFVVRRAIKQIHDLIGAGQHRIVLDGLYTWTEYKTLKHEFPGELTVVAVVAPRHLRHHRLTQRTERPMTVQEATERDWVEIEHLEKGGPIAIADQYIINDGDIDNLHRQIDDALEHVQFYDHSQP